MAGEEWIKSLQEGDRVTLWIGKYNPPVSVEAGFAEFDPGEIESLEVRVQSGGSWNDGPLGTGSYSVPVQFASESVAVDVGAESSRGSLLFGGENATYELRLSVTAEVGKMWTEPAEIEVVDFSEPERLEPPDGQVFLYNLQDDLGRDREGMENPAEHDWYPVTKQLDQYTGIGEAVVREIGPDVELVEDLLGENNEELAEFVRDAGASHHSDLGDEIAEDYGEAEGEREGWEVGFVRRHDDWHERVEDFVDVVPDEIRPYREEALSEAYSLRVTTLRRVIYLDAAARYAASERTCDVWWDYAEGVEEQSLSGFIGWLEVETLQQLWAEVGGRMFHGEEDGVMDVEDRALADSLSTLRYFHGAS